ncbi:MAG: methionine adenosyltransferase, partial [Chloroflexi bacterium]|nr:methionine adenosyltransferase [Chloroflexota bacterium]
MGSNSFYQASGALFTSESVTEGHPDKICDQIADAILDTVLSQDADGRIAVEALATAGLILVAGEVTAQFRADLRGVARDVIREVGYVQPDFGLDYRSCGVVLTIQEQSPDIKLGVDRALESRQLELADADELPVERIGAGDQGMMIGFACTETQELMPLPIQLAHGLARRLARVRKDGTLPYLRPDGKSQVTVEYSHGRPVRVATIVIAAQHSPEIHPDVIQRDIIEHVVSAVIPASMLDRHTTYYVNPTGRFVVGGPAGDTGLTGRKIIMDTYGGMARHGGGAFSGKYPTKVDRSGAYAARYVAKNIVAAGLADRFEMQIAYAIGIAHPVSIFVETFGTGKIPDEKIVQLIKRNFDLRPGAIIRDLGLQRPIYQPIS